MTRYLGRCTLASKKISDTCWDEFDILDSGLQLVQAGIFFDVDRENAVDRSYEDLHLCKRIPWLLKERKTFLSRQQRSGRAECSTLKPIDCGVRWNSKFEFIAENFLSPIRKIVATDLKKSYIDISS